MRTREEKITRIWFDYGGFTNWIPRRWEIAQLGIERHVQLTADKNNGTTTNTPQVGDITYVCACNMAGIRTDGRRALGMFERWPKMRFWVSSDDRPIYIYILCF